MINSKFIIFHQPKTAGTYASSVLPKNYILGHYKNYHHCIKNNMISKQTKLVCIVRCPLDYYISLITFWCLDPKYCSDIRVNTIDKLRQNYVSNKNNVVGHPNYWMSRGFTIRNLEDILKNLMCEDFLQEHKEKISIKHHTYDNHVFLTMLRLDIGYYTFAFLCQYSRKKVSDIKTTEECRDEIQYIHDNFIKLNQKNITNELKELCEKNNVPFKNAEKKKVSNRKKAKDYNLSKELLDKIKYKDRYMIDIFNLDLY